MRQYPLILLLILPCLAFCQTNISGIINSYHKVIEVIPSKACLRVDNTSGLSFNNRVMVIQMKGATVNTTNTSAFGATSSLNNAGNYEIGTVCAIKLDSVFLYKDLFQTYTVADKVQLVRVPEYQIAVVTAPLSAPAWDSASGKGGVLAMTVNDQLILNAPISVTGAGFRGGAYALSSSTCSNFTPANAFFYNATTLAPQNGAYKGEGVADLALSFSGGKGALANGGGGGNNHNNGGGGGAHIAAGGLGGGNSSASGCSVSNPGIGGYALNTNGGTKLFLGGGGGAGHANNLAATGGGRGGGIVFIQANSITSNGFKISANGQSGGNTTGDGASGGGAGGSIILDVNTYADAIGAEATGAIGGTESDDNISQRCYGEGGGGSGGVIYFKTGIPAGTINVNGGPKGVKQFFVNCAPLVAATAGVAGNIIPNYTYIQSSTLSAYCTVLLPVPLLQFSVYVIDQNVRIQWHVTEPTEVNHFIVQRKKDGQGWENLNTLPAKNGIQNYRYDDVNLISGSYQYRLQVIEKSGKRVYSKIMELNIENNQHRLALYPNPSSGYVHLVFPFTPQSEIRIINSIGELIESKKINVNGMVYKLDISFLTKGIYLVNVDGEVRTLVVQ